jgi:hypothetical protein
MLFNVKSMYKQIIVIIFKSNSYIKIIIMLFTLIYMAVGIRHADHVAPSKVGSNFADRRRSLGWYISLAG